MEAGRLAGRALVLSAVPPRRAARWPAPRWAALAALLVLAGRVPQEGLFAGLVALLAGVLLARGLRFVPLATALWLPMALLAGLGALQSFRWHPWDGLRDLWLAAAAPLALLLGWTLVERRGDLDRLLRAVVLAAAASSCLYVARALGHAELLALGRDAFRRAIGGGSVLAPLGLFLCLCRWQRAEPLLPSRWLTAAAALPCAAALAISLSRTWSLVLVLLVAVAAQRRAGAVRSAAALLVASVVALAGLLVLEVVEPLQGAERQLESVATETFGYRNASTRRELNRYWRSYEGWRALGEIEGAGALEMLVGQGLGARLDLGLHQWLDGAWRRRIPVLHNAYLQVALKTGLLGLACYVAWLAALALPARRVSERRGERALAGVLALSLAAVLALSSLVITGAFNLTASFATLVLLGATHRVLRARPNEGAVA